MVLSKRFSFLSNPLIQIHLAVFIWGFTAILGKLIQLDALLLVFFRMFIASTVYALIPGVVSGVKHLSMSQIRYLMLIGTIIAVHWLCFYHSIKVFDSSSIALACLGTGPMFVLWIQFLIYKKPMSWINILISSVSLLGMILLSRGYVQGSSSHSEIQYMQSIALGLGASFLAAVFTIMNKRASQEVKPIVLSFVELATGAVFIFIILILTGYQLDNLTQATNWDIIYLLALAILCTNIPFLLSIYSLEKLNPFTVTLTVNLEPIYGLMFAAFFFTEYERFNYSFYAGTFLILISVFLPLITSKNNVNDQDDTAIGRSDASQALK